MTETEGRGRVFRGFPAAFLPFCAACGALHRAFLGSELNGPEPFYNVHQSRHRDAEVCSHRWFALDTLCWHFASIWRLIVIFGSSAVQVKPCDGIRSRFPVKLIKAPCRSRFGSRIYTYSVRDARPANMQKATESVFTHFGSLP